jgi:NAD(P)-dependent dehydrogenase (short-subunit alcohol dehydrogenase family)
MQVCAVDVNGEAVREVADEVGALAVVCDVSDAEQVDDAFAQCAKKFGSVDLAHLNAGIGVRWSGDIGGLDLHDYDRSIGVNLDGVVYGVRAAVQAMRARDTGQTDGVIIATASIAGIEPFHPDPLYTIGKHGVIGLIRAIGPNLAQEGIAAHAICPGTTGTGMVSESAQKFLTKVGIPIMPPEEIAAAVVFVAGAPLETAGTSWVCQSGKEPYAFEFNDVPGPDQALNVPIRAQG